MTVKRRARLWAALILALAGASANSSYTGPSGYAVAAAPNDRIEQAELLAVLPGAEAAARASFERFVQGAMMHTKTSPDAAVRIRQNGVEQWLFDISHKDGGYQGRQAGVSEAITFTEDEVIDWSHTARNGRLYGNFTARAMMEVLPDYRAALIATTLSLDPMPKEW